MNTKNLDPTRIDIQFGADRRMTGRTVHGNMYFDVPYISHIGGNLYQGGCEDNMTLPRNIKNVVSLYPWERYTAAHNLDSFMEVRMYDSTDLPDLAQVRTIALWLVSCLKAGPTLVHCQAGLNRSSLIAAIALIELGMDNAEAINLLRDKRSPAVLCNKGFEQLVLSWEAGKTGVTSNGEGWK